MVAVPGNLDLSQNDNFEYDDDGRLYYVDSDSKILCSEYQSNVTDEGRLIVEEGVTGVQVYLLSTLNYDYLDLPSTFCEVGYSLLKAQAGIRMQSFPISTKSSMSR